MVGVQNRWSSGSNSQAAAFTTDQYSSKAARARSLRGGVKAWNTNCVNAGAQAFEQRGCFGSCLRFLICSITLALAATAGTGAWIAYHNLHLRFWLAHLIYLALTSLTVSLATMFFTFAYQAYVANRRIQDREAKRQGYTATNSNQTDPLSAYTLRTIIFIVFLTSGSSVIAGGCVFKFGDAMEKQLLHNCGKSGTTHYLEAAYEGLSKFHDKCTKDPKYNNEPISKCPGFKPAEPAYAGYIKYLEATSGCMGFCTRAEKPLWAVPDDGVAKNLSCSTYMANYIWTASLVVGVANTAIGVFLLSISMSLLCVENF